jgi:lipopolysaccharide export system protein LptA
MSHIKTAITACIFALSASAYALPEDQEQEIVIISDHAELDRALGYALYKGNVDMVQGSLHIRADKVRIYTENEEVTKVVAIGLPAHYEQIHDAGQEPVHAYGEEIEYEAATKQLTLLRQAKLTQNKNHFNGDKIVYDITNQRIKANSVGDEKPGRIRMVIQPKKTNP